MRPIFYGEVMSPSCPSVSGLWNLCGHGDTCPCTPILICTVTAESVVIFEFIGAVSVQNGCGSV